jgi:predicted membrane chloride channel (bestrophin family)
MQAITNFSKLVNRQTIIVIALSLLATYACLRFNYIIDLPTGIIGIAVVFPIVFSINAAYRRREEALRYFASLKAHAAALYYAHRDWVPTHTHEHADRMAHITTRLLQALHQYFSSCGENEQHFQTIYQLFDELSHSMEQLRRTGIPANEISRANQYLRSMIIDFERMRNIYLYRTPTALRTYSQIFLNIFPVLFAPYFAYLSAENSISSGFLVAALYGLILVSLENIQEDLENPFDGVGADDLNLNVADHYRGVLTSSDPYPVSSNQ